MNFLEMTQVFMPFQSGLVFKFNRASLAVFDIKIAVITPFYEFIVTFYYGENEFDWGTTHDEPMAPKNGLKMTVDKFC